MSELAAEDQKIVTLARSSRARNGAAEGAAVRDTDGRTYAGTTVALSALQVSALQAAVSAAVSSGAPGFEGGAVVGEGPLSAADQALAAELGFTTIHAMPDGSLHA